MQFPFLSLPLSLSPSISFCPMLVPLCGAKKYLHCNYSLCGNCRETRPLQVPPRPWRVQSSPVQSVYVPRALSSTGLALAQPRTGRGREKAERDREREKKRYTYIYISVALRRLGVDSWQSLSAREHTQSTLVALSPFRKFPPRGPPINCLICSTILHADGM